MSGDPVAEQLFVGWLARRQEGDEQTLEDLLAANPTESDALRSLAQRFQDLEGVLALIGMDDTVHAPVRELDRERRGAAEAVLERLRAHRHGESPYTRGAELGSGSMARVMRIWDEGLERELAMKVLRLEPGEAPTNQLLRFLSEARLTGSLEHPGIVPVHDLGLDAQGRVYFTMRRVDGLGLDEVFARSLQGDPDWSLPRVLEVLVRVCDTLAFAHARGVVHRDLKPANVMVGEFGETYVLDWGLALVLDHGAEPRKPGLVLGPATDTVDGDVVGTPAYMPPEQAAGKPGQLGATADVYAIGAMLYELLSGRVPYAEPGVLLSSRAALERVVSGPPRPLGAATPDAPRDLVAVCEKAMARAPGDRYADAKALAADLRAHVEGRVVRAHTSGPWAELAAWVRRNRPSAAFIAAAGLVVAVLIATLADVRARGRTERTFNTSPVLLDRIETRADRLWPAWPGIEPELRALLAEARAMVARTHEFEAESERLAALGLPSQDPTPSIDRVDEGSRAQLDALNTRIEVLEAGHVEAFELDGIDLRGDTVEEMIAHTRWDKIAVASEVIPESKLLFDDPLIRDEYALMTDTVHRLQSYGGDDPHTNLIADLERRLEWAQTIHARSIAGYEAEWERAREEVAACPHYLGLDLVPQLGLVPLGCDPVTQLQEFAHLASGSIVERGPDGLVFSPDSSVVFVLVPGGLYHPQRSDSGEGLAPIRLDPFFLAKHELTQAQWLHLVGSNPSRMKMGTIGHDGIEYTPRHPVEHISWFEAERVASRLGLTLPTMAQWQHAARADTDTASWTGDDWESHSGLENLGDLSARESSAHLREMPASLEIDDGWPRSCPVDALAPNPWGLYHMLGNVSEWSSDLGTQSIWWPYVEGTGARRAPGTRGTRVCCGGHWNLATSEQVGTRTRTNVLPDRKAGLRGVRFARPIL